MTDADALEIRSENKTNQPAIHLDDRPSWATAIDMSDARGLGCTVTGDGSGAVLVITIDGRGNRDYVIPIDFQGTREIAIPNGEVAWGHPRWGWRFHSARFDYRRITRVKVGFGTVPSQTTAQVTVGNIRPLRKVDSALRDLTIKLAPENTGITASDLMKRDPVTISPEASTLEAIGVMRRPVNLPTDLRQHEAARRLQPPVKVKGGDKGLKYARLDRAGNFVALCHALAQPEQIGQPDRTGDLRTDLAGHDHRLDLGQLPLQSVGVAAKELLADDHAEHGVPEELEALVTRQSIVGKGGVREWVSRYCPEGSQCTVNISPREYCTSQGDGRRRRE